MAKVLSWGGSSEIFVFGAVYIDGPPAAYLMKARNIGRLAGSPGYLGIGELPATATGGDLSALTLEADDIKALKSCREQSCDVQLPTESIQAFHEWRELVAARRGHPGQQARARDGARVNPGVSARWQRSARRLPRQGASGARGRSIRDDGRSIDLVAGRAAGAAPIPAAIPRRGFA